MLSFIVAMDKNRVMGHNNQMPWHIPNDFKFFKETTMNHTIIMGRKTWQSIGRVLPNRKHIILTRQKIELPEAVELVSDLETILKRYQKTDEEVFIIGGANVFKQFFPYVNKMYITEIDEAFKGDVFFPNFNEHDWQETERVKGLKDHKNPYDYDFVTYARRES